MQEEIMVRVIAARLGACMVVLWMLLGAVNTHADSPRDNLVTFADGQPCYYRNAFFNKNVQAVVQNNQAGQQVNQYGTFLALVPPITSIRMVSYPVGYSGPILTPGYQFSAGCENQSTTAFTPWSPDPRIHAALVFANKTPKLSKFTVRVNGAQVVKVPAGSTVDLVTTATDPDGDTLQYTWRAASGNIVSNGTSARWTLPNHGGLQFAYVLVNDGRGGYVEGGITVSTDSGVVVNGNNPASIPLGTALKTIGQHFAEPSIGVESGDHFLTFFSTKSQAAFNGQGADSALGACRYYEAIRAVAGCGPNGELLGQAENFRQWRIRWKLMPSDPPHASAIYTNVTDLNLERDMHVSRYSTDGTAYYVCNYPRSATGLNNVKNNENLVACVAMEYSITPGVNRDANGVEQKFIKFLTFGPGGDLISSVNLDTRGEKYMPGVCVACHGAKNFVRFSELLGASSPVLESQFLPFDLNNFRFAAAPAALTRAAQEVTFHYMNNRMLDGANPAITETIQGYYAKNGATFDSAYVPPGWATHPGLYKYVVREYCRGCHVALTPSFSSVFEFAQYSSKIASHVCGVYAPNETEPRKLWSMPNSKVTFDRFWRDSGAHATLDSFLRSVSAIPPGATGCDTFIPGYF